ncbi:glycosyltransferase family 2 protein [Burkholderia ubonensis]|uniref:glycosyltransferase family 2 protein n=1 Tax=Burkholderia ubonensis TaxID=101571 RepID=UPI00075F6C60|nr:glycosyltransferase family 2 protein [Burkholderia ubonensis]KVP38695.1 rhamnosyltransferase [Burkholderia ubonensis]KVQ71316.1 rhamnosyltransferase [Burkholderia ubonensis]KVR07726.1 rhamnosyltransferase [Burkholderia ubonensis]KWD33898.1 rhamnosyltransferase [Burkholderia ubonensis]KWD40510.1 rhamnosyltransferase [Burkholderia ubonensis]
MTALGALVILYHPTDAQLASLDALRRASDALLVVDNSPQPDARAREACARDGIALLHHGNRGGIAGAFNAGLAALFRERVDAVALFDQDSTAPDAYFPAMRDVCAGLAPRAFLAGPRIFDENARSFLPELSTNGITLRRLNIEPGAAMQRCAFLISSGCVVSRDAYDTLGPFDETLFIDHVDTEYCLRALARNVPLYVVPSLVLTHRIGAKRRHALGPFAMTSMNHPWQRRYYSARNAVQLGIQYGLRFPVAIVPNLLTLWQIVQIALVERDKRAKLGGIALGIVDGLFGRFGPLERTRPRLAARVPRVRQG